MKRRSVTILATIITALVAFTSASEALAQGDTWAATGSLNTARVLHTATLLPNGMVLVAGGFGPGPSYLNSAELYDPASGTWTATGSLNTARDQHTATLLPNGMVLVAGGIGNGLLNSAELYDPASGTWTATGSLNSGRFLHTASLLPNGMVLVAGGLDDSGWPLTSAELYDPASGTWTATGSLNTERYGHTASLLPNGMVLVAGGLDFSGFFNSAELYDPASGTWTTTGSLNSGRFLHTASLLPNGMVLVAGGFGGFTNGWPFTSAELYDPASGTWTATGSLNTARYWQTASLLPNGMVLVAGGFGNSDALLNSAELYDPASGTWTATGSLNTARGGHKATLLPNGTVLVAGGLGPWPSTLNSAELYAATAPSYSAQVQQPINADGSSVFSVRRGVVPVKFTLTQGGVATCDLPPATITVTRTSGGTTGAIDESVYSGSADTGSNFRIDSCQYVYNLSASALGVGTYRVDIIINAEVVGSASFALR